MNRKKLIKNKGNSDLIEDSQSYTGENAYTSPENSSYNKKNNKIVIEIK